MATCRECGCTDERACPGGCYWVEPDLCSVCAGEDIPEGELIRIMLELIDIRSIPLSVISSWTPEQRIEVASYVGAIHLKASDNDIEIPPLPAVLQERKPHQNAR